MITKINKIKNFANFSDYSWDNDLPTFAKKNIIFGYNGSGKTTISNVFYLFSEAPQLEKEELINRLTNDISTFEIELQADSAKLKYSQRKSLQNVYTFNRFFVSKHIYDGSITNLKLFDKKVVTKEQLKNPEINSLEKKISDKNLEKVKYDTDKKRYEEGFEEIKKQKSKKFNEIVSNKRMTGWNIPEEKPQGKIGDLENELNQLTSDYDLSKKQDDLKKDIETLDNILLHELIFDNTSYNKTFQADIKEGSRRKTEEKINSYNEYKLKKSINVTEWFEDGFELLKQNNDKKLSNCPLCNSEIDIKSIIDEYQSFFDEEYSKLSENLKEYENVIKILEENFSLNMETVSTFGKLLDKYSNYVDNESNKLLMPHKKKLKEYLEIIAKEVSAKKKDFNYKNLDTDNIENLKNYIDSYNLVVKNAKTLCEKLCAELKNKSLNENQIIDSIKNVVKQIGDLEYDSSYDVNTYKKVNENIELLDKDINKLNKELASQIARMKNESKYVNGYLKQLGVHNFEIDIDVSKTQENISIRFMNGTNENKQMNCLSEGEKTSLAFAYFLSKLQYEIIDNTNAKMDDCIIVIDDPVSSLDENRLFTTAYLIDTFFAKAEQLFVFSHNLIFLKFFGNIIKSQTNERNDYFVDQLNGIPLLKSLPKALQNYQTAYFQKLEEIIEFVEKHIIDYETAKKYLPSYIRVVLETFLSFKFYHLKQGSSNEKFLTAGLDKLIKHLLNQIGLFKNFTKVGNIDSNTIIEHLEFIKKSTDPQCHGTPQNIDEFNFLSESELNRISKDTIDIIHFLDNIHYEKITVA